MFRGVGQRWGGLQQDYWRLRGYGIAGGVDVIGIEEVTEDGMV